MDDLVAAGVIIAIVIIAGTATVLAVQRWVATGTLKHPNHKTTNASDANFRIAQKAVRILDQLMADDMTRCVIPEKVQTQIRDLSDRFYN